MPFELAHGFLAIAFEFRSNNSYTSMAIWLLTTTVLTLRPISQIATYIFRVLQISYYFYLNFIDLG